MLLKVDRFEGFSNQSNIDELVINSISGRNCKNCKLYNNNYKLNNNVRSMKTVFSYSEYFPNYVGQKYPLYIAICLQNLEVYFQLSLREICIIVKKCINAVLPFLLINLK